MKGFTLLLLATIASVRALDITLKSYTCDRTLPVYALGFRMSCSDGESERCSFGETATFSGNLQYNGTAAAGVNANGIVYGKAGLQLMTLDYELFNNVPLYMCGPWVSEVEENDAEAYENTYGGRYLADADAGDDAAQGDDAVAEEEQDAADTCAGNGMYTFYVDLDLPENDDKLSWLATGWKGVGDIMLFANSGDSSSLVGYCTLNFATHVTPQDEIYYLPSALIASLSIIGVMAAVVFSCCFCRCCRKGNKKEVTTKKKVAATKAISKPAQTETPKPKVKRSENDCKSDPIEMSRSVSELEERANYQYMEDKGELA